MLKFVEKICSVAFPLVLHGLWKKLALSRMSSCTTCLIRNSDTSVSLAMDLINSLRFVNHSLDFSNKFRSSFLFQTIRVRFLSWRTFVITIRLIRLFSNPLRCPLINTQTLCNLLYCCIQYKCPAVQLVISTFLEDWITSWCYFHYQSGPTDSGLL